MDAHGLVWLLLMVYSQKRFRIKPKIPATTEHLQLFTAVTGLQMEKIGQPL